MHQHKRYALFIALSLGLLVLDSCKTDSPEQITNANKSSFQLLQEKVITPSCTGCHTTGSNYANESGLVLDAPVAYQNLFAIPAHQVSAHTDGLLRIKAGDADNSLLYLKVHGFPQGKNYGSMMPLGYKALTIGQQQFIHDWINAGAPKTGNVADPSLLDDTSHYPEAAFIPLDPPAPGEGFQVSTGNFDIRPNFEREIFVLRHLGNSQPVYINHIHTRMRTNSHHLVLYTFDPQTPRTDMPKYDIVRDLRDSNGADIVATELQMLYHNFLGGAMSEESDFWFPQGIAVRLDPSTGIDVNAHYVNRTSGSIPGEAYANIYTMNPAEVKHVAEPIISYSSDFTLPPHQETTVTNNIFLNTADTAIHLFLLTSHNHSKGRKFQIQLVGGMRNGEVVYESTDWEHPVLKTFDPPIVLNKGEGMKSIVTYYNDSPNDVTFGFKSTDEMNVIFAHYY